MYVTKDITKMEPCVKVCILVMCVAMIEVLFSVLEVATFMPTRETYTVDEIQGTIQVCFTSVSGGRSIRIVTHDDTALGECLIIFHYIILEYLCMSSTANSDYVPIDEMVSFERERRQCINIQIINDELTEGEERFRVVLMKDRRTLSSAYVIINDNSEY